MYVVPHVSTNDAVRRAAEEPFRTGARSRAAGLAKRVRRPYVLEKGQIRYEGPMEDLMRNDDVAQRYLSV